MSKNKPIINSGPLSKDKQPSRLELTSEQIMAIAGAKSPRFDSMVADHQRLLKAQAEREAAARKHAREPGEDRTRMTYDWTLPNAVTPLTDEEKSEMGNYIRYSMGKSVNDMDFQTYVTLRRVEKQQGASK